MMYLCEPKHRNREARKPLCLFILTGLSPKVVPLKLLLKPELAYLRFYFRTHAKNLHLGPTEDMSW